jgi:hypothetical protein
MHRVMGDSIAYVGLHVHKESIVVAVAEGGLRGEVGEAAWCYRFPARVSRELRLRQENQPKPIHDIAWKGQVRLCARYRRLARTSKPANIVTTAVARELSASFGRKDSRGFACLLPEKADMRVEQF